MMHRLVTGLLLLILPLAAWAQNKSHRAFEAGEEVRYKAYYNWGFIWIHAGNVTFSVEKPGDGELRFKAYGKSLKSYDWMFKVRDRFQSDARADNLSPLHFIRDTYEGGYAVNNEYTFNHSSRQIYTKVDNSKEPYREDTLSFTPPIYDVLTAIYHARNLDFSKYSIDQKIPLSLIIDNEIYDLYLRHQGREEIKVRGGNRYNCIKFSAMLVEGTIFSGGEHLTVWVTDDKNRIPVMVKAKILVGSVKAVLKSTRNLKYPSVLSDRY